MNYWGLIVLIGALVLFGVWYGQRQQPPQEMGEMGSVQSHRSFSLSSNKEGIQFEAGEPASDLLGAGYLFSIVDDRGKTVEEFATVHEKIMHAIVVRKDLTQFQHLHPRLVENGQFVIDDLVFRVGGEYRVFADFAPLSAQRDAHGQPLQVVLFEDITVKGSAPASVPVDTQQRTFGTDGYTFTLATTPGSPRSGETVRLRFTEQQAGRTLTNLESYLGALGHVVVLRQEDLEFLHTHPVTERQAPAFAGQAPDGVVEFEVAFPTAGTYKIFGQFQHAGKVLTSEFGIEVEQGPDTTSGAGQSGGDMMEMMEHMMPDGEAMSH